MARDADLTSSATAGTATVERPAVRDRRWPRFVNRTSLIQGSHIVAGLGSQKPEPWRIPRLRDAHGGSLERFQALSLFLNEDYSNKQ